MLDETELKGKVEDGHLDEHGKVEDDHLDEQEQGEDDHLDEQEQEEDADSIECPTERREKRIAQRGTAFLLQQLRGCVDQEKNVSERDKKIHRPVESSEEKTIEPLVKKRRTFPNLDWHFPIDLSPVFVEREIFNDRALRFYFSSKFNSNNYLKACKWSSNGRWLLTNSQDRIARVFQLDNDGQRLSPLCSIPQGDLIYDLCWQSEHDEDFLCRTFATTSRHHPIHLWDIDGHRIASFRGINHLDELSSAQSICFSLNGDRLYAGYKRMIRVFHLQRPGRQSFDVATWKKDWGGQKAIISAIAMNPRIDGVYAAASYGRYVGIYSDQTKSCDCVFGGDISAITHIKFSADGNLLYGSARKENVILCWDLRVPDRILCSFNRPGSTNQRFYFDLDRHERYMFSGTSDGRLVCFDLDRVKLNSTDGGGKASINPNSTGGGDKALIEPCWQLNNAHCSAVSGIGVHPERALLASVSGQRVFPFPLKNLEDEEDKEDNSNSYERNTDTVIQLDNSLKLWSFDGK